MTNVLRDLVINFLAATLFAVSVFLLSQVGLALALVLGLSAALVGCIAIIVRGPGRRARSLLGMVEIRPGPNKNVESMLNGAKHSIDFLGLSGNRTGRSATSKAAIEAVAENSGRIRFLLLNPNSRHLERRAADEGDDVESLREDILGTVRRLLLLRDAGANLVVRYYDHYPVFRMVNLDNETMAVNWFLDGRQGHHSPELILSVGREGLSAALASYYDELWRDGEDAFASATETEEPDTSE